MILLQAVTMIAIAATAGFFVLYLTAIQMEVTADEKRGTKAFLDGPGRSLIFGARTAFAFFIALLIVVSVHEVLV